MNAAFAHLNHAGVRDPRSVEPRAGLAGLVLLDLAEGSLVDHWVPAGNEGGHATDGMCATLVAGGHEQLGVGVHERHRHRDLGAVRQHEVASAGTELLDNAEDVVPAAGVEPRRVLAQLVEDLLHLERGRVGLDEDRGANGAHRDGEELLGADEHVVPEPGLEVALQLGEVEVRALACVDLALGAVEEIETEVDQAARHRVPVHDDVLLGQMPAARPDDDRG